MEAQLINTLLRIFHSPESRYGLGKHLREFYKTYNLGKIKGTSIWFTDTDKAQIALILKQQDGVDAANTKPGDWNNLSRAECLELGGNEKLTKKNVRSDRVAIKSLPGHAILLADQSIWLPPGGNLDMDARYVAERCQHKSVLVVENWEVFENIHAINFDLGKAGDSPLVVFRGCPAYPQNAILMLLKNICKPVYAFVDFDPAGLVIAMSLPFLHGVMYPDWHLLDSDLGKAKNHKRYQAQLPGAAAVLDVCVNPEISRLWQLIKRHGQALPQEHFIAEF